MKSLSPLSILGFLLSLAGLVINVFAASLPGVVLALVGVLLADKESGKLGSTAKNALAISAALFFSLAAGVAVYSAGDYLSFGMGMALVLCGGRIRGLFLNRWGATGFMWVEPLLQIAGLGLVLYDTFAVASWPAWLLLLLVGKELFGTTMGLAMHLTMRRLANEGRYGVNPGAVAPDFNLSDESSFPVTLSSFKGRTHVLLIFVRGDWCPSCHITLRTYGRHKDRFQEKGIALLAIGPDPVGVNKKMVEGLGVPYKMLSDEGQKTAMAYGVQTDDKLSKGIMKEGVPLPASFLVDKNGVVRYTSRPERAGEFLDPNTIFPALQGLAA